MKIEKLNKCNVSNAGIAPKYQKQFELGVILVLHNAVRGGAVSFPGKKC